MQKIVYDTLNDETDQKHKYNLNPSENRTNRIPSFEVPGEGLIVPSATRKYTNFQSSQISENNMTQKSLPFFSEVSHNEFMKKSKKKSLPPNSNKKNLMISNFKISENQGMVLYKKSVSNNPDNYLKQTSLNSVNEKKSQQKELQILPNDVISHKKSTDLSEHFGIYSPEIFRQGKSPFFLN